MKNFKKIAAYILLIAFTLTLYTPFSYAGSNTKDNAREKVLGLGDGIYCASIMLKDGTHSGTLTVSPRVALEIKDGKATVLLRVTSYSGWSTLQLLDQDAANGEKVPRIGDGWKPYEGKSMENYEKEVADLKKLGYDTSASLWTRIDPAEESDIDKATDLAIISFPVNDLRKYFSIAGYAHDGRSKYGTIGSIVYKINPKTIEPLMDLMGAEPGDLKFDAERTRHTPISQDAADFWARGLWVSNVARTDNIKCDDNFNYNATFVITEDCPETIKSIKLITGRKYDKSFFDNYLLGDRDITYSNNIYDPKTGKFTVDFAASNNVKDFIFGRRVVIETEESRTPHSGWIYLSTKGWNIRSFKDEKTGVSYYIPDKYAPDKASKLTVKTGSEVNKDALETIKKITGDDPSKYRAYKTDIVDNTGKSVKGELSPGCIEMEIPKDWDKPYIAIYSPRGTPTSDNSENGGALKSAITYPVRDGKKYVRITFGERNYVNGCTLVMGIPQTEDSLSKLAEDGIYKAGVKFIKFGESGTLSMADMALNPSAYVVVKEGRKDVYLNFKAIDMGGNPVYLGHLWSKNPSDTEFFDFETNDKGELIDNVGFDPIEEFSCIKAARLRLYDDTIHDNSYGIKVIPPAMGANFTYEQVMSDPIDADLKFYNIKKIQDDSDIAYHQKSVLRKSIDKAKRYPENAYSKESYDKLRKALQEGEKFYKSLKKDAGKDHEVSAQIKEKSDKIEEAIKDLKDGGELTEARDSLKASIENAKEIEKDGKTDIAFRTLQEEIEKAEYAAAKRRTTVDDLKKAEKALKEAVKTFRNSRNASTLDPKSLSDGEYKVYAEMLKPDRQSKSMANKAIKHWITLNVKNGEYKATLDFDGITIQDRFGYLQYLFYYDKGYTYDENGNPGGMENLKPANVLSTQKDKQGNDVIDDYNDKDNLYPKIVEIPLVDKGMESFEPLCVYVPIMESLNPGSGQQNVLLKLDWTTLRNASDTSQDVIKLEDGLYSVKSEFRDSKNQKSPLNDEIVKTRLIANKGKLDVYLDIAKNTTFKDISIGDKKYEVKDRRIVLTLPENIENTDIKITDIKGNEVSGKLNLDLKNAKSEEHDKTALEKKVKEAKEIHREKYTEESLTALDRKIAAANNVLSDKVAIKKEISKAGLELSNAMKTLKVKEITKADKAELEKLINTAKSFDSKKADYTKESYAVLASAVKEAEKAIADENVTKSQIDQATKLLAESIKALEKNKKPEYENGTYEIQGDIWHAYNKDQKSMADGSLAYTEDEKGNRTKLPLHIIFKEGKPYLKLKFMPLTQKMGENSFTGYLGDLAYYPEVVTETPPTKESRIEEAEVLTEYEEVVDEFNDPEFGTDNVMKGKLYPKEILIPIEKGQKNVWLNVYVPVMESIQEGGGRQNARLELDWSKDSFKKVINDETPDKTGPDKPDKPIAPEKPDQPGEPSSPEKPDQPGKPSSPEKPDNDKPGKFDTGVNNNGNNGKTLQPKLPSKPGNMKKAVKTGDRSLMVGYGMLVITLSGAVYFVMRRRKDI